MSITISLVSAAVIACSTLTSMAVMQTLENITGNTIRKESFETSFADAELLHKTLVEHGCCVEKISENEMTVSTTNGILRYTRNSPLEAFRLVLDQISNPDVLLEQIRSLETDYGRNVQTYTYQHIKQNLTEDMQIEDEQILEDDSLLLTIDV
ncbi:MAG: hypothetical protein ACI4JE_08700 [Ruminococcus sp.]